jgi:HIP---CoA ligase
MTALRDVEDDETRSLSAEFGMPWPSLAQMIRSQCELRSEHLAIIDGERRLSYQDFGARALEVGRGLIALGVDAGDRVAVWAPNSMEWLVVAAAALRIGAIIVPVNTRFKGEEAAYVLRKSRARVLLTVERFLGNDYLQLIHDADLPELAHRITMDSTGPRGLDGLARRGDTVPAAQVEARTDALRPRDVAHIMFTSGTTGHPKGVMVTHEATIRAYGEEARMLRTTPDDVYLITSPLFHAFGYASCAMSALMFGATMIPTATFDAGQALTLIEVERVTIMQGPPTIYQSIMEHPRFSTSDVSSMRAAVCGSTRVPLEMFERIRTAFGLEGISSGYGLTESSGAATYLPLNATSQDLTTSSGAPLPGVELRIRDLRTDETLPPEMEGEICIRGYNVMRGYFDDPEQTAEAIDADGWLRTGDVGLLTTHGRVRVTDRLKDMFIMGGFNAYPAEIEHMLESHPDVATAAVVGVPDERFGEVGFAFVVPTAGAHPDPDMLIAWARGRMANFKVPRGLSIVDSVPLTANGKVKKTDLAPIAAQLHAGRTRLETS